MKFRSQSAGKQAFTLIELLVVIAIIAILAAILFPVFAKVREKARQTSCVSNEKQIGLGIMQYVQDYDEYYPTLRHDDAPNPFPVYWRVLIYPYMKNRNVFQCPSNPRKDQIAYGSGSTDPSEPPMYVSYAYSDRLGEPKGWNNGNWGTGGLNMAAINEPANKIAVAESIAYWPNVVWPDTSSDDVRDNLFAGHTGVSNYVFCDGHVKALRPTATESAPGATPSFNMWGALSSPSNNSYGMPGTGVCTDFSINCDTSEPTLWTGLQGAEAKYK